MDAGVEARTGTLVESVANFSLRFSSLIVIDSGSSFANAAAVGLSESVAANALSPTLTMIRCRMDLFPWESCRALGYGAAKGSARVTTSDAMQALCTMLTSDLVLDG